MKYKLLKDTFSHKKGEIAYWTGMEYKIINKDFVNYYHKETIENNPEWFEPVKEKVRKKVWGIITKSHFSEIYFSSTLYPTKEEMLKVYGARFEKEMQQIEIEVDE